ncbi:MAG: hypothetical protein QF918_11680 [Pirellulaceae bacterium]|nr:hypothetical protein [Pirellulaceae bacterium]
MPIETICPGCGRKLRVGDEFAGKQARCPVCNEIYSVSGVSESIGDTRNEKTWRLKTPEGQIYGPVLKEELDKWVTDGRVTAECQLAPDEANWDYAGEFYPVLNEVQTATRIPFGTGATESPVTSPQTAGGYSPVNTTAGPTRYRYTAAHRGGLILALAVISWVIGICPIFGLFAWIMGSGDLREMRLGRMDPSGMGLTQAGQIIGMIHSILFIIGLLIFVFVMLAATVAN